MLQNKKEIPKGFFKDCRNIKKIAIPPSIKSIGNYAFCNCSIEQIIIPSSVTKIGVSAFKACTYLKYIIEIIHLEIAQIWKK